MSALAFLRSRRPARLELRYLHTDLQRAVQERSSLREVPSGVSEAKHALPKVSVFRFFVARPNLLSRELSPRGQHRGSGAGSPETVGDAAEIALQLRKRE